MTTLYPAGVYKPLGPQTQPRLVNPTAVILHTMGGYLNGTDSTFRANGYTGDESHFGIGGSWDGKAFDGIVWQWQDLDYTADAQYAGNAYGISIETSDGAVNPTPEWTPLQIDSITSLLIWLCVKFKIQPVELKDPTGNGIGYHSLFPTAWNHDGHNCPGDERVGQLINIIIPAVSKRLLPAGPVGDDDMPAFYIITDGTNSYKTNGTEICHVHDTDALKQYSNAGIPTIKVSTGELGTFVKVGQL